MPRLAASTSRTKPTDAEKAAWTQAIGQLADNDSNVREAASKKLSAYTSQVSVFGRKDRRCGPGGSAILVRAFEVQALEHYRKAADIVRDLKGSREWADSQISAGGGRAKSWSCWRSIREADRR